ncbi:acetyl-CoA carboxylase biotin carboxyl carrier protein subunit [bacterium]|nr:acetyl-CoA carboxylase biotin carboxyl carrier protein subunit [bacterium]
MIRLDRFQELLSTALAILGDNAGRVELSDGRRRVRVGRLLGQVETDTAAPVSHESVDLSAGDAVEALLVRVPGVGAVSFRDNRTGRPLVEVGQRIRAGQTLAFITAMDVTTKVTAPRDGVVEEVFVEDGDGVEYNAPLLKLIPIS